MFLHELYHRITNLREILRVPSQDMETFLESKQLAIRNSSCSSLTVTEWYNFVSHAMDNQCGYIDIFQWYLDLIDVNVIVPSFIAFRVKSWSHKNVSQFITNRPSFWIIENFLRHFFSLFIGMSGRFFHEVNNEALWILLIVISHGSWHER